MAFKLILSPELRRQREMMTRELERLYRLPDRWLGEELLKLARRAREENPKLLGQYEARSYSDSFVWEVVPEVARRLGAKLSPNESQSHEFRALHATRLRQVVGTYLQNTSLRYGLQAPLPYGDRVPAIEILEHEFVNGNPVAFAMDRLADPAPEGQDRDDWLARHLREVGRYVGLTPVDRWSPDCVTRTEAFADPNDPVREIDLGDWTGEPLPAPSPEPEVRYEGMLEFGDMSP